MNRRSPNRFASGLLTCCVLIVGDRSFGERGMIVNVTSHRGQKERQVLSETELRKLQGEIAAEMQHFHFAKRRAEVLWKRAGETGAFPMSLIHPPAVQTIRMYPTLDEAQRIFGDESIRRDNFEAAKQERLEKAASKKTKGKGKRGGRGKKGGKGKNQGNSAKQRLERQKKFEAAKVERDLRADIAFGYYQSALAELKAGN